MDFFKVTMCQTGWQALLSHTCLAMMFCHVWQPATQCNYGQIQVEVGEKQGLGSALDFVVADHLDNFLVACS